MAELFDASPRLWLAFIYIGAMIGGIYGKRTLYGDWDGAFICAMLGAMFGAFIPFAIRGLYFVITGN